MFYIIAISFIFGIGFRSIVNFNEFYLFFLVLIAVALYAAKPQKKYLYITLGMVFLFLGFLRFNLADKQVSIVEGDIEINGIVTGIDVQESRVKYVIDSNDVAGKVLVTMRLYPRFNYRDQVLLKCKLKIPEEFDGFAYDKYLAKSHIYSLCYYPDIIEQDSLINSESLLNYLFKIKNKFIVQINKLLPSPHSALLSGLLIGDTTGLPKYIEKQFIDTGTIHIVAMSGYNIMIIIALFLKVAPFLSISRRITWIIIIPTLVCFVVLTGAESSIVRAAIMGIIAALASESGRLSDVKRLLVITAIIMLIFNPYLLWFDIGFQLSFLATLGLVYITPFLDSLLNKLSFLKKAKLINLLTTTLGAQIAVAPLLFYHFGRISLISPIANIAILWIVPFVMALGFVVTIISFFYFPIGQLFAWYEWLVLEYIFLVVKFLS